MASPTKLSAVVSELQSRIETSQLVAGQRLVEADLTREFNVSRAVVREALRYLAAERTLEIVPNRGAIVRRLSRREALELFDIRSELEGMAVRCAASRMGDPTVRNAFRCATEPLLASDRFLGALEYLRENEAFHRAVVEASANASLADLTRRLRLPLLMSQLRDALTDEVLSTSRREHRDIASAILAGDSRKAERLMDAHLARATGLVAQLPQSFFVEERHGRP